MTCHTYFNVKLSEKIISEQINTKFVDKEAFFQYR